MTFLTVSERKRRSAERLAAAADAVMAELSAYARSQGSQGRFIVFGSAASEAAAYNAVEESCGRHGIKPDVLPVSTMDGSFIDRVMKAPVRILP